MIYSVNSDLEFSGYYRKIAREPRTRLLAIFGKKGNIDLSFHNPEIRIYEVAKEPFAAQTDPDLYYDHHGGFAYQFEVVPLPVGNPIPDDDINHKQSRLLLLEDGIPLGPAHSLHKDIETIGEGRYCHWLNPDFGPVISFSASDNTDPNNNKRIYEWVYASLRPDLDDDRTFSHYGGFKYELDPPLEMVSDCLHDLKRSRVVIFENGRPLGPAHSSHEDILEIGEGRYSFWNGVMLFSTSDNTDPNRNERSYRVLEVPARPDMDLDLFYPGTGDGRYIFEPDSSFLGPDKAVLVWLTENNEPMTMFPDESSLEPGGWCRGFKRLWFSPTNGRDPNENYADYRLKLFTPVKTKDRIKKVSGSIWKIDVWENYLEDTPSLPRRSKVVLFRKNRPIGPAHADPSEFPEKPGAYIHKKDGIYFNPPVGSDPASEMNDYTYYEVIQDPYLDPDRFFEPVDRSLFRFDVNPVLLPFIERWETLLIKENDRVLTDRTDEVLNPDYEYGDCTIREGNSSILFSPSDKSDPNTNGKIYRIEIKQKAYSRDSRTEPIRISTPHQR